MKDIWLKERDKNVYCPYEEGQVVYGLSVLGNCPGKCVGEFWIENGEVFVELSK